MTRTKPDMTQEMRNRWQLLAKASESKELQAHIYELCRRDILYWFRNFVYTDKNTRYFSHDEPSILPFIPFPFQEECILEVWESIMDWTRPIQERTWLTSVFIEKSRQMGISWLVMAIFTYGFIFHNHKYHVISQKEELVDKIGDMKSLFGKIRFIIGNLPTRMLPQGLSKDAGTVCNKYMTISRADWTWAITGESANPNASRSGTYNAIFLDEFAHMSNAVAINTAAASATPCRIYNSTPNGEGNEFYRMRRLTVPRKDEYWRMLPPEIKGLRYHWTDHPLKDQAWYDEEVKGMSKEKIAQELDISYNTAIVGRVYPTFATESISIEYDPERPLYVFMDNSHWWADPHAIILAQRTDLTIDLIDSIELNCSVTDMAEFMAGQPKPTIGTLGNAQLSFLERYKKYNRQKATFIDDPYDTHTTLNQSTIYEEYKKVWIYLNTPADRSKTSQIQKTQGQIYKIRYSHNCSDMASAIMNARYPERPENSNSSKPNTLPVHDWTSHYRTALEYGITRMLENPLSKKWHKALLSDTPFHNSYYWPKFTNQYR